MKKVVFITSILLSSLIASSIEDITKKSLENSFDIKGLQKSIQIASEQINIAKNWENPMLSFKTNNIMLNKNYLNSQKEYGIEISQSIPIGDKLEIERAIAQKDKLIQEYNLDDKKLELTSKIYSYSYLILIIENRLNLLNEYQNNLNHLEKLYTNLFTYNKANLNEILNTQISKDELQMQIDELETKKRNLYLNLEILSLEKIDKIDDKLDIKPINKADLEESIQSHPKIKTLYTTSQKYKDNSKLEEAKKFSSITLGLEYMQNSEQDYANIYLSIPLPIYNTENINKLKANLNANETNNRLDSQIHNLKIQNEIFLNNLELANRNYKLIEEQIIPKKQKIQKLLEEFVEFDKSSLEESVKNLNELIDFELKATLELEKYFENYSELIYYSNKGVK
jgi:outer membrane protein, heavy metal efflux system